MIRAVHIAKSAATPSELPVLLASKARSWTENSCSRGFRSPTSSAAREYRFASAYLTASAKAWGAGRFRILTPLPGPSVTSIRYRPEPSSWPPGLIAHTWPGGSGSRADLIFALQLGRDHELLHAVLADRVAELRVAELGACRSASAAPSPGDGTRAPAAPPTQGPRRDPALAVADGAASSSPLIVLLAAVMSRPLSGTASTHAALEHASRVWLRSWLQHSRQEVADTSPKWSVNSSGLIFGTSQPGGRRECGP